MAHNKSSIDLEYVFVGVQFEVEFLDGSFTEEEQHEIKACIDAMSREMHIDKSYVECIENKRKGVFILETGWNALNDAIIDSKFCRFLPEQGQAVVADAFTTIARCYMYDCLAMKTDKLSEINITVKSNSTFDIIVCKDSTHDYKKYAGRWQDWEFDETGKVQTYAEDESK